MSDPPEIDCAALRTRLADSDIARDYIFDDELIEDIVRAVATWLPSDDAPEFTRGWAEANSGRSRRPRGDHARAIQEAADHLAELLADTDRRQWAFLDQMVRAFVVRDRGLLTGTDSNTSAHSATGRRGKPPRADLQGPDIHLRDIRQELAWLGEAAGKFRGQRTGRPPNPKTAAVADIARAVFKFTQRAPPSVKATNEDGVADLIRAVLAVAEIPFYVEDDTLIRYARSEPAS